MNSDGFIEKRLGDICKKIGSGATPTGGKESYLSKGEYALIRSQNVLDFCFSYDGLAFINNSQATKLNNVTVEENDVLLNITGDSVARVCQVPKNVLPARVNQHVSIIRPKEEKLNSTFLKYYLLNPPFKNFMLGLSSVGGTRNALTKTMIEDFKLFLPSLPVQKRIATILSSLDDKIELNRQTNQTLEAIAQALFKEWFVDFNFPGSTGEMENSELGEIPKGWKVGKLGDIFTFKNGKSSPERNNNYEFPVYGANGIIGYSNTFNSNERSIIIGRVGSYCGAVYYTIEKSFVTENAIIADAKNTNSSVFCYITLESLNLNNFRVGSGQPLLNQTILSSIKIALPPPSILAKFEEITYPLFNSIYENNNQCSTLGELRDSLLPKLMQGEIKL